jgi:hypothetical protein
MKKSNDKTRIIPIRIKLAIRSETVALLTAVQLEKIAGGAREGITELLLGCDPGATELSN